MMLVSWIDDVSDLVSTAAGSYVSTDKAVYATVQI